MDNELISIICTVKNGEGTLVETIDSVLNQTYHNWEMIIVDDGSKDNTESILKKYSEKENRIKPYITNGIGRGKSLNKAIDLAQGDYITNLDADDAIHPQKLEIQINVFKNNTEFFLVSTKSILIYEDDKPSWDNIDLKNIEHEIIDSKLLVKNRINHSSVMMNKLMLKSIGKYSCDRKSQLDYELWLRAYYKNMKMIRICEKLTAKRIHQNQSFENKKRFKYLVNSSLLQLKYNWKLKSNWHLILVFPFRVTLGLLPFKYRKKIRKLLRLT